MIKQIQQIHRTCYFQQRIFRMWRIVFNGQARRMKSCWFLRMQNARHSFPFVAVPRHWKEIKIRCISSIRCLKNPHNQLNPWLKIKISAQFAQSFRRNLFFIKTYPFGMIKQIGRIYGIWIILSGNKFEWFWKDLYDFARRALPHTPREAWFPLNPLNRSAGTCWYKTYSFGMIKLIQQIYRMYSNLYTGLCKWANNSPWCSERCTVLVGDAA